MYRYGYVPVLASSVVRPLLSLGVLGHSLCKRLKVPPQSLVSAETPPFNVRQSLTPRVTVATSVVQALVVLAMAPLLKNAPRPVCACALTKFR